MLEKKTYRHLKISKKQWETIKAKAYQYFGVEKKGSELLCDALSSKLGDIQVRQADDYIRIMVRLTDRQWAKLQKNKNVRLHRSASYKYWLTGLLDKYIANL